MKKATDLYGQFRKGTEYFKEIYARRAATPPIERLVQKFEAEVVRPFDAACQGLTAAQRGLLEEQI